MTLDARTATVLGVVALGGLLAVTAGGSSPPVLETESVESEASIRGDCYVNARIRPNQLAEEERLVVEWGDREGATNSRTYSARDTHGMVYETIPAGAKVTAYVVDLGDRSDARVLFAGRLSADCRFVGVERVDQ